MKFYEAFRKARKHACELRPVGALSWSQIMREAGESLLYLIKEDGEKWWPTPTTQKADWELKDPQIALDAVTLYGACDEDGASCLFKEKPTFLKNRGVTIWVSNAPWFRLSHPYLFPRDQPVKVKIIIEEGAE